MTIDNDQFIENGSRVPGAGLYIQQSSITNGDYIQNIRVTNSTFNNNSNFGIFVDGTSRARNLFFSANSLSGAMQTTAINLYAQQLNTANPPLPAGLFMVGAGIYYSNGSHYCAFSNMPAYTALTGRTEVNGISRCQYIPAVMIGDGLCTPSVAPAGLFLVGNGIFYSNGAQYCTFSSMASFTSLTGRTGVDGIPAYQFVPQSMASGGFCTE